MLFPLLSNLLVQKRTVYQFSQPEVGVVAPVGGQGPTLIEVSTPKKSPVSGRSGTLWVACSQIWREELDVWGVWQDDLQILGGFVKKCWNSWWNFEASINLFFFYIDSCVEVVVCTHLSEHFWVFVSGPCWYAEHFENILRIKPKKTHKSPFVAASKNLWLPGIQSTYQ